MSFMTRLGSLSARDIMTPRTVMSGLQQDMTVTEALDTRPPVTFSRLPLYKTDLDTISGFVLRNDLLFCKARDRGNVKLETLRRKIQTVPDTMALSNLLEFMLDQRQHIALVVDEYGGTKVH